MGSSKTLRKEGPEVLPIAMFSRWRLIPDALLTEKVWVKQALEATKEVLSKSQKNKAKALLYYDISSNMEAELLSQPVKGRPHKLEEEKTYETRKGKPQEMGRKMNPGTESPLRT